MHLLPGIGSIGAGARIIINIAIKVIVVTALIKAIIRHLSSFIHFLVYGEPSGNKKFITINCGKNVEICMTMNGRPLTIFQLGGSSFWGFYLLHYFSFG